MSALLSLMIGTLLLSLVHAAIPNHWVPLVLIGRSEKWSLREVQGATLLTGFVHILSTIMLGVIIGLVGLKLSEKYKAVSELIAPIILIFMGLVYFALNSEHHHSLTSEKKQNKSSKISILATLSMAMFLSPCLEIETYFFTAGTHGFYSIMAIAGIYFFVTLIGMLVLVTLGYKSLEKYNWHFLEHHEKKITGTILIAVGILSFFIKI